mmetsp:Transcript_14434/g.36893  ORF Transcript_14434/g.36893 Transcript_14434/m.36893 type:complete len:115 (-) Transcript_14434:192-536(-)
MNGLLMGGLGGRTSFIWMPSLLPKVQEHPWSLRAAEDEEALLAAEELQWEKKMTALRQSQGKGHVMGEAAVEATEDDHEMDEEESQSDDFAEPSHEGHEDNSQGIDWEVSQGGY